MKKTLLLVLTAFFMLTSTSAMAQVNNTQTTTSEEETTLRADVNGDGVVDVADITAVIQLMKKYYWYIGWTKPTSLSHLQTLVAAADSKSSLGGSTSNPGPSGSSNKLLTNSTEIWNYIDDTYTTTKNAPVYVVIPTGYEIYDVTLQNQPITDTSFTPITDVTIANHEIYTFNDTTRSFGGLEIY